MSVKKYIATKANGIFEVINNILKEKGISTTEFPLVVNKLQLRLEKNNDAIIAGAHENTNEGRKCKKWGSELRKVPDPHHPGETIIQLVEFCEEWEDD